MKIWICKVILNWLKVKSQKILESYLKIMLEYTWIWNAYQWYISHLYIYIQIMVILHRPANPRLNFIKQKQVVWILSQEERSSCKTLSGRNSCFKRSSNNILQILIFM